MGSVIVYTIVTGSRCSGHASAGARRCPTSCPKMVEERIVSFSLAHPGLGPKRLLVPGRGSRTSASPEGGAQECLTSRHTPEANLLKSSLLSLPVEIHRELVGVRPDLHAVGLLAPEFDVGGDQVVGEDPAAGEERVVGLERVERLVECCRDG